MAGSQPDLRHHTLAMSYHLTILRTAQGNRVPIPLDDVRRAAQESGDWAFSESPPALELKHGGAEFVLWYEEGELWTSSPEREALAPMLALATRLQARVRGDEYETYATPDQTYEHPDDVVMRSRDEALSLEMLRRDPLGPQRMRLYIIGFFAVLGCVGFLVGKWFERP